MAEDVDSLFGRIIHPVAQSALKSECGKLTDFTKIGKSSADPQLISTLSTIWDKTMNFQKINHFNHLNIQWITYPPQCMSSYTV